jgi:hypothetical protein
MYDPFEDIDYSIVYRCVMDWITWIVGSLIVGGLLYYGIRIMCQSAFRE